MQITKKDIMEKTNELIIILCNADSKENADLIVNSLVIEKLIACGSIFPEVKSVFEWNGELQNRSEFTMMFKTISINTSKVVSRILELHNDEVPEIISLKSDYVFDKYFNWVEGYCGK